LGGPDFLIGRAWETVEVFEALQPPRRLLVFVGGS
jgi:hypothetical protein